MTNHTNNTMTLPEALRADSCTFPSYTLALHKRAANEIEKKEKDIEGLASALGEMEAELASVWDINERLLRLLPNNAEAVELCKDIYHSTEGQ